MKFQNIYFKLLWGFSKKDHEKSKLSSISNVPPTHHISFIYDILFRHFELSRFTLLKKLLIQEFT